MTLCICGHEERHHDNEVSRCDKIGCGCQLFRPDYADIEFGPFEESPIEGYGEEEVDMWMGRKYQELEAQLATLTAERDSLRAKVAWLENSIDVFTAANRELTFAFNLAGETCRKLEAERDALLILSDELIQVCDWFQSAVNSLRLGETIDTHPDWNAVEYLESQAQGIRGRAWAALQPIDNQQEQGEHEQ